MPRRQLTTISLAAVRAFAAVLAKPDVWTAEELEVIKDFAHKDLTKCNILQLGDIRAAAI